MFDIFNKQEEAKPQDVKSLRESLLRFIKEQLQKFEGGEGGNIKGLQLYINCAEEEKQMYQQAVFFDEEERFKREVQKIADDYAIDLPESWTMYMLFVDAVPPEAINVPGLNAGLFIQLKNRTVKKDATAYLRVLNGEAEKEEYLIRSEAGRINIGREKKVLAEDGFFRINNIAFPNESSNESNKFISRQHAHIEYDQESEAFVLYPDEGGIPPKNKVKVRTMHSPNPVKLNATTIGHRLQEGDQIMLGESALLQFSFLRDDN